MSGVGFISMLIIGVMAGYIAERVMERDHGFLTNALVGIAGSFVGGTLASVLDITYAGFISSLIVSTLGAVSVLWFFSKSKG